jgi:hypothetical protein
MSKPFILESITTSVKKVYDGRLVHEKKIAGEPLVAKNLEDIVSENADFEFAISVNGKLFQQGVEAGEDWKSPAVIKDSEGIEDISANDRRQGGLFIGITDANGRKAVSFIQVKRFGEISDDLHTPFVDKAREAISNLAKEAIKVANEMPLVTSDDIHKASDAIFNATKKDMKNIFYKMDNEGKAGNTKKEY